MRMNRCISACKLLTREASLVQQVKRLRAIRHRINKAMKEIMVKEGVLNAQDVQKVKASCSFIQCVYPSLRGDPDLVFLTERLRGENSRAEDLEGVCRLLMHVEQEDKAEFLRMVGKSTPAATPAGSSSPVKTGGTSTSSGQGNQGTICVPLPVLRTSVSAGSPRSGPRSASLSPKPAPGEDREASKGSGSPVPAPRRARKSVSWDATVRSTEKPKAPRSATKPRRAQGGNGGGNGVTCSPEKENVGGKNGASVAATAGKEAPIHIMSCTETEKKLSLQQLQLPEQKMEECVHATPVHSSSVCVSAQPVDGRRVSPPKRSTAGPRVNRALDYAGAASPSQRVSTAESGRGDVVKRWGGSTAVLAVLSALAIGAMLLFAARLVPLVSLSYSATQVMPGAGYSTVTFSLGTGAAAGGPAGRAEDASGGSGTGLLPLPAIASNSAEYTAFPPIPPPQPLPARQQAGEKHTAVLAPKTSSPRPATVPQVRGDGKQSRTHTGGALKLAADIAYAPLRWVRRIVTSLRNLVGRWLAFPRRKVSAVH
jgi:hypothetical protein